MKKLIIINGSPRKNKTSYSFARTIKQLSEIEGNAAEIIHAIEYFDGVKGFDELRRILASGDMICLVAPLYFDTLPYPTIWFYEKLASEMSKELHGKYFFAIGQCGFPDITLCEPILDASKYFAEIMGMHWLGGVGYGGGAILDGALLEELGSKGKKITAGLQIALRDVFQGKVISPRAQELLTVRIPRILYRPLAAFLNHIARKTAKKHGTNLRRQTYLE